MRYAILSDIHANLEALQACVEDAKARGAREFICLGDIVGYGANPKECISFIRDELNAVCIAGNHDWAVCGKLDYSDFNKAAQDSVIWTKNQLSNRDLHYLKHLPLKETVGESVIVHGTLDKPEYFKYLYDIVHALDTFYLLDKPVCFVGHTHVPIIMVWEEGKVQLIKETKLQLNPSLKTVVNVGSVGQPRDGNPQASYCIYDPDLSDIEIVRVSYNIEAAQEKIKESHLPLSLAERLLIGQ